MTGKTFGSICLFMLLWTPLSTSTAATWYVRANGNNASPGTDAFPWRTIQFAIDNSSVVDGDIILVGNGNYAENIDITKEITLRSENGPSLTIIQALTATDHVIAVRADHVTVDGVSIWGATDGSTSVVAGIYLASGTRYGNITNNICGPSFSGVISNYYGIYLYNSDNNTISGNEVTENVKYGIRLYSSEYNNITDNEVHHNYSNGIHLNGNSHSNTISDNTVEHNGDVTLETGSGLVIITSSLNTVNNNTFRANEEHGVYLDDADDSTISNNMCHFNSLNGIYLNNGSNGSLIQLNMCGMNTGSGIAIEQCSGNTIDQNSTYSGGQGITMDRSSENDLTGNSCNGNEYGIYLEQSSDNDLTDNYIQNNSEYGIYLSESDDNNVQSNSIYDNYSGIVIINSSDRNVIQGNTSNNNYDDGIWLSGGYQNQLIGNGMNRNDCGLRLSNGTHNNELTGNVMVSGNYGAILSSTSDNRFWLNTFSNNSIGNVSSATSTNIWVSEAWNTYRIDHPAFTDELHQGYLGNYFDDHPGSDSNGNGVMDIPYDLPGAEPDDDFPLTLTTGNYVIVELLEGDINGDGGVGLEDVITALQAVTGQGSAAIFRNADMNDDDKIGLSEAIALLHELSSD